MACGEESCVPEDEDEYRGLHHVYPTYGDPFGRQVLTGGLPLAVLACPRSGSRKRLSPDGLAEQAVASYSAHNARLDPAAIAWQAEVESSAAAMIAGCRSISVDNPNSRTSQRMRSPSACAASVSEMRAAYGKGSEVASAALHPYDQPTLQPAPELEAHLHEVPVITPGRVAATIATAASAFAPDGPPGSHPASQGQWAQPYSALLSGPGFDYGADGDGVFETDLISMGSLGSGGSGGFMIDEEEEGDSDGGDSVQYSGSIAWSAGTAGSGSGERAAAVAATATLPLPAPAIPTVRAATSPECPLQGGGQMSPLQGGGQMSPLQGGDRTGAGLDYGAAATVAAAAAAAAALQEGACGMTQAAGTDDTDGCESGGGDVAGHERDAEEGDDEGEESNPSALSGSSESVGSAGANGHGLASSTSSHEPCLMDTTARGSGVDVGTGSDAPGAAAAPAVPAADVVGATVAAAAAAADAAAIGVWAAASAPQLRVSVVGPRVSDAASPLPMALQPPQAPALLQPEVYLGFVSQLVASVRAATQAASQAACHARYRDGPAPDHGTGHEAFGCSHGGDGGIAPATGQAGVAGREAGYCGAAGGARGSAGELPAGDSSRGGVRAARRSGGCGDAMHGGGAGL